MKLIVDALGVNCLSRKLSNEQPVKMTEVTAARVRVSNPFCGVEKGERCAFAH